MIGKFKLSQNRDQSDAVNVVNNLEKQGQIQLAEAVKQYIED
jgi:transcriptional regulator